ncbi:TetR/AcrR family transcriptional regulator [Streptomyces sp. LHD-70]|uniref:TetR/AcrR family transcriptional regulator n=1 Tax=Streptomyces sp. LHD-70 TaxID=3072140 RepID=UPI00280F64DA|nr:TetR/AcrR family transcriptional regulator [Streptomyces sp. LHD-70]MDQ8706425.1 TetR/AcrR family transcriptional regulator [Streptomyces sp. LHD-70]
MARVSQEHLDARRRQIIDGAVRSFTQGGFHATSMQDVLREAGLSAGAVYRYFSGKEELIAAIVGEVFGTIRGAFEDAAKQDPPPLPDQLLGQVLNIVLNGRVGGGSIEFPRLVLQVWAETLRNEELAAPLRQGFVEMRAAWGGLVDAYREAGLMPDDVEPDHVARTMMALAQGFIAQRALFGDAEVEQLEGGLRALMRMEVPKVS